MPEGSSRAERLFIVMRTLRPLAFVCTLALCAPLAGAAQGESDPPSPAATMLPVPPARTVVTHHTARIGGRDIQYTATAGTILLTNQRDQPAASVRRLYGGRLGTESDAPDHLRLQRRTGRFVGAAASRRVRPAHGRHRERRHDASRSLRISRQSGQPARHDRSRFHRRGRNGFQPHRRARPNSFTASIRTAARSRSSSGATSRSTVAGIRRNISPAKATARPVRRCSPRCCKIKGSRSTASS